MSGSDYSLYIVRCADGSLYTGIALDVARRLREHESGTKGSRYLRGKGPLRLEFEQAVGDRSLASRAEYRVKQLSRAQKESLLAGRLSLSQLIAPVGEDQASGVS